MKSSLTGEQEAIVCWSGKGLAVNAFAGSGKTSTRVHYAKSNPDSKVLLNRHG